MNTLGRIEQLSWLAEIEWLSPDDALSVYTRVDSPQSRNHYGFDPAQVHIVERVSSEIDMTAWLRRLLPASTSHVLIVFQRDQACRLSKMSFIENWQDIFVPSRDDAIVIGENTNWVLFYCHEDDFEFGQIVD